LSVELEGETTGVIRQVSDASPSSNVCSEPNDDNLNTNAYLTCARQPMPMTELCEQF
jgi:hypothetical protein